MPNTPDSRRAGASAGAGAGTAIGDGAAIAARGLEKTYGSRLPFGRTVEVLDGADFELRAGELVGIVGENGSGKSTLMEILVGALEPDAGTVERSNAIGWCPQDPLLYDRLTVRETARLFGQGYGMTGEATGARLDWLADRLGFEQYLDERIDRLSGGNRQKVNLAVSLLHDPDVLLLDEPYTGFDWETYQGFWTLADELAEQGTAVAVISHFVEDRERFDAIYELRDGQLHEQPIEAEGDDAGSGNHAADRDDATDGNDAAAEASDSSSVPQGGPGPSDTRSADPDGGSAGESSAGESEPGEGPR